MPLALQSILAALPSLTSVNVQIPDLELYVVTSGCGPVDRAALLDGLVTVKVFKALLLATADSDTAAGHDTLIVVVSVVGPEVTGAIVAPLAGLTVVVVGMVVCTGGAFTCDCC